jgi:hypothetical protein
VFLLAREALDTDGLHTYWSKKRQQPYSPLAQLFVAAFLLERQEVSVFLRFRRHAAGSEIQ